MIKQLQGILYYVTADIRYSLSIFWMILVGFLLLTVILNMLFGGENMVVSFNFSFPIYVFAGIVGYITVKNVLPYLIKLGATRTHLFVGIGIFFILIAFINTLIANVLHSITTAFVNSDQVGGLTVYDGDESYNLHHLADILSNNGMFSRMIIDTTISFFLYSVFFIIGLIFYRYGLIGGFSFIGILILTIILGLTNGWLIDFFIAIFSDFSIIFFYQLLLVGIVVYLLSYLLMRRFTV